MGLSKLADHIPILDSTKPNKCHIQVPDFVRPISAIYHQGKFYGYARVFPSVDSAERVAERLTQQGTEFIFTKVKKGLVLWVLEPDARLIG